MVRGIKDRQGMALREADLGSGVDTICPVRVNTVNSLQFSYEFIRFQWGSSSDPSPFSSVKLKLLHQRMLSDCMKAGQLIVDDIILPVCERVSCVLCNLGSIQSG